MKRLRVLPTDSIVCYDSLGLFSAPRAAWMFRFFGAENVRILNGGLKKWKLEEYDDDSKYLNKFIKQHQLKIT